MDNNVKITWVALAVLLLLNAFDSLVLGLFRPMQTNWFASFTGSVGFAFVSIVISAVILIYLSYTKND
jgi:hypothetical protein